LRAAWRSIRVQIADSTGPSDRIAIGLIDWKNSAGISHPNTTRSVSLSANRFIVPAGLFETHPEEDVEQAQHDDRQHAFKSWRPACALRRKKDPCQPRRSAERP